MKLLQWVNNLFQLNTPESEIIIQNRKVIVKLNKSLSGNGIQVEIVKSRPSERVFFELIKRYDLEGPVEYNENNIPIIPLDNPDLFSYFTERHQSVVSRYILRALSVGVKNNAPAVSLFQFGNTSKIATIQSKDYEIQLEKLMKYFVKTEDYESASLCRDSLTQHGLTLKK